MSGKKKGYYYDFAARVNDFRQRWERLFKKLAEKGYDGKRLFFQVKIENLEKEVASITISDEFAKRFVQAQKEKGLKNLLDGIAAYAGKIGDGPVKVVGNKIIAKGECGLSYIAHVFPLIYHKIEERMEKKEDGEEAEKKKRVTDTRRRINDHVGKLIIACGLEGRVSHYTYYEKGVYNAVIKRTRGRKYPRSMRVTVSAGSFHEIEKSMENRVKEICIILDGE